MVARSARNQSFNMILLEEFRVIPPPSEQLPIYAFVLVLNYTELN